MQYLPSMHVSTSLTSHAVKAGTKDRAWHFWQLRFLEGLFLLCLELPYRLILQNTDKLDLQSKSPASLRGYCGCNLKRWARFFFFTFFGLGGYNLPKFTFRHLLAPVIQCQAILKFHLMSSFIKI